VAAAGQPQTRLDAAVQGSQALSSYDFTQRIFEMRLAKPVVAAALCAGFLLPTATFAEDATPSVDLIANFVIGIDDGSTLAINGDQSLAVMKQTGPGKFEGAPEGQPAVLFEVVDKGGCIFDISYTEGGTLRGGIEIDANKLKSVTYDETGKHDKISSYKVTLVGGEGVVQLIGPDGKLAPTEPSSPFSSSLTIDEMQAAVTEFQSAYCEATA
jgi:hypothetical protein